MYKHLLHKKTFVYIDTWVWMCPVSTSLQHICQRIVKIFFVTNLLIIVHSVELAVVILKTVDTCSIKTGCHYLAGVFCACRC